MSLGNDHNIRLTLSLMRLLEQSIAYRGELNRKGEGDTTREIREEVKCSSQFSWY